MTRLPVATAINFEEVRSKNGNSISGVGIICPLLPVHFVTDEKKAISGIIRCLELAGQEGCQIASLAGFTSVVGNEGEVVSKTSKIAVTSGNTFTAALVIQSIFKAADLLGLDLNKASLAVIGASGDIGIGCLRVFSHRFKKIVLAARNQRKLEDVAASLATDQCKFEITKYVDEAVSGADIILSATSALTTIIDPDRLSPGAIVCDVALPHNISRQLAKSRGDIFVYDGGLAELWYPYMNGNRFWKEMFGTSAIVGCLAEAMILSLENRFENYSLGRGNIIPERINEIWELGLKHGFRLACFQCGGQPYQESDILRIRKLREG